jgi:hemolysin activation/secretion protein
VKPSTLKRLRNVLPLKRSAWCGAVAHAMLGVLVMSATSAAWAQNNAATPSGPFQDFQRPAPFVPPPRERPDVAPPAQEPENRSAPSVRFVLRGIELRGSSRLSSNEVEAIGRPYLGKEVDFAALQAIAAAIGARIRADGWVVRVTLPSQDLTEGLVRFDVIEARFGGAEIELAQDARISLDRVSRYIDAAVARATPLNSQRIDRAILLIDDLPGVTASGALVAGSGVGDTVAQVRVGAEPLINGQISADNQGSSATGEWRLAGAFAVNSPLNIGDQITLSAMKAEGVELARLGWTVPVGASGLRMGVNTSALHYRITGDSFAALAARGRFSSLGLDASYPLIRSNRRNLYATFTLDERRLRNEAVGAVVSDYRVTNMSLGLSGSALDGLWGGGVLSGTFTLISGDLDLAGSPNRAADATGAQTAGGFLKWRYTMSRVQTLSARSSVVLNWSGQGTNKNLDTSERFFLGGASGVRAYPFGEAGGSEGQLVNLELRHALPYGLSLTGFYDWGRVQVNRNNNFVGGVVPNAYSLSGAGASLAWSGPAGTSLALTWARRIGNNPVANANGTDQDGTRRLNRIWFLASLRF